MKVYKNFLNTAIITTMSCNAVAGADNNQKEQEQPNIIIMFIDDLGYNDLGFRNPSFKTPNIDRLSESSFNFVNAYVASPTSSPSRAALLTGRHPLKIGITRHISNENGDLYGNGEWTFLKSDPGQRPNRSYMPLSEITIAEALKELNYTTYHVGKWHLGSRNYYPDKQGFDYMFGESDLGHPINYFPPYFQKGNSSQDSTYLNDYLTDKAVEWINNHNYNQSPLMMYFAHYAVHSPHIGQPEKVRKYLSKGMDLRYAQYHAMVESMDESVGRVLKAIDERGITDNTIFMFISDQGGYFTNAPLRGGKMKGQHYDGGAKVPFMVRYKGKASKIIEQRISTLDVFPSLIEMAGGNVKKQKQLDGVSLDPLFTGGKREQQPIYIYRSYDDTPASLVLGDYKYIVSRSGNDEMFDLKKDPYENNNIINDSKEKRQMRRMKKMVYGFLKEYEMPTINQ